LSQPNNEVLIKKYPNRRLYDTSKSEYITMDAVAEMVRNDIKFKVIDAKTEADLTRITLTQIILDQETKGYNLIPLELLLQMVKFCNHPMSEVYSDYLLTSIKTFENNIDSISTMFKGPYPAEQFMKLGEQNMEVFNSFMSNLTNHKNDKK